MRNEPILVSACLLGLPTRYDGRCKRSQPVIDFLHREYLIPIPVCPEQLAGLTTPRYKTFFEVGTGFDVVAGNGRVISLNREPMNEIFLLGAKLVFKIGKICNCRRALFKERSPSCGVHQIHLQDDIVSGPGVTTAFLINEGFEVFSEEDI